MIDAIFATLMIAAAVSLWDSAVVYVSLAILHDVVFGGTTGLVYFGSAGAFDLACLMALGLFRYSQGRAILQCLAITSIIVNYSGWAMWFNGHDGDLYQSMMIGVYLLAIMTIIWNVKNGTTGTSSWSVFFRLFNRSGNRVLD